MRSSAQHRRWRLVAVLATATLLGLLAGLAAGAQGWSPVSTWRGLGEVDTAQLIWQIRAPRSLGAWLTGALLGLAGAVAQGLFRNPLADPYLLGSAAGAALGVTLVLVAGLLVGPGLATVAVGWVAQAGLAAAAFVGAFLGVLLTLLLARGARETTRLLLSGVVVGVVLSALSDLITTAAPQALRGRQAFLLGSTDLLGWDACGWLALGLAISLPLACAWARSLDALTLGSDTAASLGVALPGARWVLLAVLALATGLAVSQAGLIAFVGLVAPHLVRRFSASQHGFLLAASAASGGVLLLVADLLARTLVAPQEWPVGVLTALLGGGYLCWRLYGRPLA